MPQPTELDTMSSCIRITGAETLLSGVDVVRSELVIDVSSPWARIGFATRTDARRQVTPAAIPKEHEKRPIHLRRSTGDKTVMYALPASLASIG
jgi:hypothetical protein